MKRPDRAGTKGSVRGLVRTGDEGFSLIEVVVAMAIFALVATFLAAMLGSGMRGVLLGKRREVATQEAHRTLEIARSLSYEGIGLAQSDPTIPSDEAIKSQGGELSYRSDNDWEPIVWTTNPEGHPFNPHVAEMRRGSTDLMRYVYVSGVDSDGDNKIDLKRLSVRVSWSDAGGAASEVRAQTLVNESGLIPTGPGQSGGTTTGLTPLTAKTLTSSGTISIKSARGNIVGLIDAVLPEVPVTLTLPTTSGDSTFRAISTVNCTGRSATLQGATSTYGGHPVAATADDDGGSATPERAEDSWPGAPPDSVGGLDDVGDLVLEGAVSSPMECSADARHLPPADELPYEKGTGATLGTLNMVEDLSGTGLSPTLTAAAVATEPVSQEIDHQLVAGQREEYANAANALGVVNVMKIPGVFPDGLVRVDGMNYSASVRAAEGTPSAAPAVTSPTINLRVYDVGNEIPNPTCTSRSGGYCIISVNPAAPGFAGLSIDFAHSVTANLGLTTLEYQTRVDVLPPAKDGIDGVTGPTGERRWTADYTPMSISTRLKAVVTVPLGGDVVLTDTTADLNLGSVRAEACAGGTCL